MQCYTLLQPFRPSDVHLASGNFLGNGKVDLEIPRQLFFKNIQPKKCLKKLWQKCFTTFSEGIRFEFCFRQSTQLTVLRRLALLLALQEA